MNEDSAVIVRGSKRSLEEMSSKEDATMQVDGDIYDNGNNNDNDAKETANSSSNNDDDPMVRVGRSVRMQSIHFTLFVSSRSIDRSINRIVYCIVLYRIVT